MTADLELIATMGKAVEAFLSAGDDERAEVIIKEVAAQVDWPTIARQYIEQYPATCFYHRKASIPTEDWKTLVVVELEKALPQSWWYPPNKAVDWAARRAMIRWWNRQSKPRQAFSEIG